MKTTEVINWIPAAGQKPDSDTTVLLFNPEASDPVWPGYFGGERWMYIDGFAATPTHWAEWPGGPIAAASATHADDLNELRLMAIRLRHRIKQLEAKN